MAENIYFHKDTGHYQVAKKINGKSYSFGTYDTFEEAKNVRDYFKDNGWDINERLIFSKNSFIHYYLGKYHVNKTINGRKYSFGVFDDFEDARYQVYLCKRFGWDLRLKPFDCMKYIHKRVHATGKVVYRIVRWVDGKDVYYGTFSNLDDAKFERDLLMVCDWDYDNLESVDDAFNGREFLKGIRVGSIPFYRQPNGRIDYGVL